MPAIATMQVLRGYRPLDGRGRTEVVTGGVDTTEASHGRLNFRQEKSFRCVSVYGDWVQVDPVQNPSELKFMWELELCCMYR